MSNYSAQHDTWLLRYFMAIEAGRLDLAEYMLRRWTR